MVWGFFLLSIQKRILDKQTEQNTWPEPNLGSKQIWIRNLWLRSVILHPVKQIYVRCVHHHDIWTPNHLVGWVMFFGIFQVVAQEYVCILRSGTLQLGLRGLIQTQKHSAVQRTMSSDWFYVSNLAISIISMTLCGG